MDRQTTTIIIIDQLPSNIIFGHQDARSSKQISDMCFPPFTCHHHHPPSLVKLYLLHKMDRQTTTIIIGDLPPSKIISGHHDADLANKYHICVSLYFLDETHKFILRAKKFVFSLSSFRHDKILYAYDRFLWIFSTILFVHAGYD
ncbi:unnamed protein product [Trifolium pratense]|uniref:Uncharacterized protein n=1 Tax=Trifolium pratense TaxID=57577 RepID=A0ACB0LZ05_TRIPR|nr:unnamed protein product [Trifolium pratense]